mmetsp:Transcript_31146/g.90520  ORF Transcript_31146/g.90520 Transcript_31146/m.90520 type:complete len:225 (+) Transcript_31146:31-705(+)
MSCVRLRRGESVEQGLEGPDGVVTGRDHCRTHGLKITTFRRIIPHVEPSKGVHVDHGQLIEKVLVVGGLEVRREGRAEVQGLDRLILGERHELCKRCANGISAARDRPLRTLRHSLIIRKLVYLLRVEQHGSRGSVSNVHHGWVPQAHHRREPAWVAATNSHHRTVPWGSPLRAVSGLLGGQNEVHSIRQGLLGRQEPQSLVSERRHRPEGQRGPVVPVLRLNH